MDGQQTSQRVERLVEEEVNQRTVQLNDDEVSRRIAQITQNVNENLRGKELDGDAQKELSTAICLLMDLALTDISWLRSIQVVDTIDVSTKALLSDPPNIELTKSIHKDLSKRLHPNIVMSLWRSFKWSMRSSPTAVVVTGLGVLFYFLLFPALLLSSSLNAVIADYLKVGPPILLLIGIVGALGSIVSIMIRVRVFRYAQSRDPWPFFFFGLFKPIVGAVFALFIFAAMNAALIPGFTVPQEPAQPEWFFVAIAFLAGFSERFAGDVVGGMEKKLERSTQDTV